MSAVLSDRAPSAEHSLPPWHQPFATPAVPFSETSLEVLSGRIPDGLEGTYFQNGTGRLSRGSSKVGHWFDGDGAILRVGLAGGQATAGYRYVETAGYRAEQAAGRYLYGNYGMRHPGSWWQHLRDLFSGNSPKNSANTSVLALEDRLLALWEGGNPHSLQLDTLETIKKDSLGWLAPTQAFSAHPLRDPISGEIYNIGMSPKCELSIYRCDRRCQLLKQRKISLTSVPLLHSFAMAGPYLIFLISPVEMQTLPLLLNQKPYADILKWRGDRPTRLLVIDREGLETIADVSLDPWFQWHLGNGCQFSDGTVRLDFVRFDNFTDIHEVLREIPTGRIDTKAPGQLWQLRIDPVTGDVLSNDCLVPHNCEFPLVPSFRVGQPWDKTYLIMHKPGVSTGEDWFGAVGYYDYSQESVTRAALGDGIYCSEPLPVCDRSRTTSQDNPFIWLIVPVYNSNERRSEIWIFDDRDLTEPVCRLALPSIVALGFHSTWQPSLG